MGGKFRRRKRLRMTNKKKDSTSVAGLPSLATDLMLCVCEEGQPTEVLYHPKPAGLNSRYPICCKAAENFPFPLTPSRARYCLLTLLNHGYRACIELASNSPIPQS